jgi:hypothetical protein
LDESSQAAASRAAGTSSRRAEKTARMILDSWLKGNELVHAH